MRGWIWAAILMAGQAAAEPGCPSGTEALVVAGDQVFRVEVAADAPTRQLGLSGRERLAPSTGMWFVLPATGWYGFWMKDMRFAIDLVWVGDDRRVLKVEALEPCGQGDCPSRFPPAPVSRVLEVNRGEFHAPVGSPIELGCQLYQP